MTTTPELDKMTAAREAGSDTIGTFIDWLQQQGYVIARWEKERYRVKPDELVFDQAAPDRAGGSRPVHRTISKSQPALCGAAPQPFTVGGQVCQQLWYGERSARAVRGDELCAECESRYQAGEWPEREGEPQLFPAHKPIETWLAEYFGIDLAKVEEERAAILAELRKGTAANATT